MRAILVSVDYGDLLAITLPRNRPHFDEVMVVTTPDDIETQDAAKANNASVFLTRSFYDDGAHFNKFKALELGLDAFGRSGTMCLMDADIVWPKDLRDFSYEHQYARELSFTNGWLYGPQRYIWENVDQPIPDEMYWRSLWLYRDYEFPGYSQIFHADDPHLPPRGHWHQTDWIHAGGADSMFQCLWEVHRKHRLMFPVLHLGTPWENWAGRVGRRTDGTTPEGAVKRQATIKRILDARRKGRLGDYSAERLTR